VIPRVGIRVEVNGTAHVLDVPTSLVLADLLREELGLTGTKVACDQAVCGACTVLVDGRPVAACSTFAFQVDGRAVLTIEGLRRADGTPSPVQQAFAERSAFQCGYCTSGMILLATALLAARPLPDRATVVGWLGANVCRCTGYQMIVEAVEDAALRMAGAGAGDGRG
jgi:aerobic carbon-monoxide dehydrogenase small subunit